MRLWLRAASMAALLLLSITVSGCGDDFYFSFKEEQSLHNGSYSLLVQEGSPLFLPDKGLVLDMARIITPLHLTGDATIKIRFHADCSEFELGCLRVHIWTGTPEVAHIVELYLGSPADQLYKLVELYAAYEIRAADGPDIPGYHGPGDYTLRVEKRGNQYSAYLGFSLLGRYEAEDYIADWFYLSLAGELFGLTTPDSLYVKDIRVSYDEGIVMH
ncbi:MAG TPA: hypothetical protein PLT03_05385 [Bacillota bacterium]|nr:hypothetical protein [Bacillota bacterium]